MYLNRFNLLPLSPSKIVQSGSSFSLIFTRITVIDGHRYSLSSIVAKAMHCKVSLPTNILLMIMRVRLSNIFNLKPNKKNLFSGDKLSRIYIRN